MKNILIIDDNNNILDLFEIILYKDYNVITAVNGFEGLQKATEQIPDLIIADIIMPVMNGIQFFNKARKVESLAKVPIVAFTDFSKEHNIKSLLSMGFSATLPKPFNKEKTLSTINKLLGNQN